MSAVREANQKREGENGSSHVYDEEGQCVSCLHLSVDDPLIHCPAEEWELPFRESRTAFDGLNTVTIGNLTKTVTDLP